MLALSKFTRLATIITALSLFAAATPVETIAQNTPNNAALNVHGQNFMVETASSSLNTDVPTFENCDPEQQRKINAAIPIAQGWARDAVVYFNGLGANPNPANPNLKRYKTWFGEYDANRYAEVLRRMAAIRTIHFEDWRYKCDQRANCGLVGQYLIHAQVNRATPAVIEICGLFWSKLSDDEERATTLIHEASHFDPAWDMVGTNGDGKHEFYGGLTAQTLAKTYPERAIRNADNYAFFNKYPNGCGLTSGDCIIL